MILELITPLLIASQPITLEVVDVNSYDHVTQVSATVAQVRTMSTTTFNGTGTFDFQVKPYDNDNDTDADPF
jgi:hypothetical protein